MSEGNNNFNLVKTYLEETLGITVTSSARFKLERRIEELGLADYYSYLDLLRYGRNGLNELEYVFDHFLNHETYFFREYNQFSYFKEEVIPQFKKKQGSSSKLEIRILSAGCSTGEEVYTLAFLLLEAFPLRSQCKIDVLGVDASKLAIKKAREGVYSDHSFRALSEKDKTLIAKYFEPVQGGLRVKDEVKQIVSFGKANLLNWWEISHLGQFDCIFCRNLLMYLKDDARKKLVWNLERLLKSKGLLFLGHAETLFNLTSNFQFIISDGATVYRRIK